MKNLEKNFFWIFYVGVFLSGVGLGYLKYLYKASDISFGIVSHPWQIYAHKSHLIFAMIWMLIFGFICASHALPKYKAKQKKAKRTGVLNGVLLIFVSLSGYMIQVIISQPSLNYIKWSHIIVGCVTIAPVFAHYWQGKN